MTRPGREWWRMDQSGENSARWSWWYLLFVIQFVGVLWPPFYNRTEPSWIGLPFFYWYQLAWVPVSSLLIWLVYRSRTHDDEAQ